MGYFSEKDITRNEEMDKKGLTKQEMFHFLSLYLSEEELSTLKTFEQVRKRYVSIREQRRKAINASWEKEEKRYAQPKRAFDYISQQERKQDEEERTDGFSR